MKCFLFFFSRTNNDDFFGLVFGEKKTTINDFSFGIIFSHTKMKQQNHLKHKQTSKKMKKFLNKKKI